MSQLSRAIATAFPLTTVAEDEIEGIPPEEAGYKKDMGGRNWAGVPEEAYESHTDAFILMSPNSLKYFIAGFLSVACRTTNSLSSESLIYAATHDDHLADLCKVLTPDQIRCLFDVVEHVYLDNYGHDDDEKFILIRNRKLVMLKLQQVWADNNRMHQSGGSASF